MMGRILTQDASASCQTVLDVPMLPKTGSAGHKIVLLSVMPVAKQGVERLRSDLARLPVIAKVAPVASTYQCHD